MLSYCNLSHNMSREYIWYCAYTGQLLTHQKPQSKAPLLSGCEQKFRDIISDKSQYADLSALQLDVRAGPTRKWNGAPLVL